MCSSTKTETLFGTYSMLQYFCVNGLAVIVWLWNDWRFESCLTVKTKLTSLFSESASYGKEKESLKPQVRQFKQGKENWFGIKFNEKKKTTT